MIDNSSLKNNILKLCIVRLSGSLDPVLVAEYQEEFELIVVETKIANKNIRIKTGYGPQENNKEKMKFFKAFEKEIASSQLEGKLIIIALDANSKLGKEYIENYPKDQSENGIILAGIIESHALCVANGLTSKRK